MRGQDVQHNRLGNVLICYCDCAGLGSVAECGNFVAVFTGNSGEHTRITCKGFTRRIAQNDGRIGGGRGKRYAICLCQAEVLQPNGVIVAVAREVLRIREQHFVAGCHSGACRGPINQARCILDQRISIHRNVELIVVRLGAYLVAERQLTCLLHGKRQNRAAFAFTLVFALQQAGVAIIKHKTVTAIFSSHGNACGREVIANNPLALKRHRNRYRAVGNREHSAHIIAVGVRYRVRILARRQVVRAIGLRIKRLLARFHHNDGVCRRKTFGSRHVKAHRLSRHCSERDLARHIGIGDVNRARCRFVAERGSFVRIRARHNGVCTVLSG